MSSVSPPNVDIDHLFPPYTMEKVQALNQSLDYELSLGRRESHRGGRTPG